jgi:hypothetical protein
MYMYRTCHLAPGEAGVGCGAVIFRNSVDRVVNCQHAVRHACYVDRGQRGGAQGRGGLHELGGERACELICWYR